MSTRTITEAEYRQIPTALDVGRRADISLISSKLSGPAPAEVFALAEMLLGAGYGDAGELTHLRSVHEAVQQASADAYNNTTIADANLSAIEPAEAVALVRQAAINRILTQGPVNYFGDAASAFENQMRPVALASFRAFADTAVTAMRPTFNEALRVIVHANKAGLTPDMTGAFIATDGTTKQVASFRALGPAVATLDHLAGLRIRTHNAIDRPSLAPETRVMACFLAGATDEETRDGAANAFTGAKETVLVSNDHAAVGPAVRQVPRPRLGGAWLSLIAAGHTLTLNTPTEVDALLDEEDAA